MSKYLLAGVVNKDTQEIEQLLILPQSFLGEPAFTEEQVQKLRQAAKENPLNWHEKLGIFLDPATHHMFQSLSYLDKQTEEKLDTLLRRKHADFLVIPRAKIDKSFKYLKTLYQQLKSDLDEYLRGRLMIAALKEAGFTEERSLQRPSTTLSFFRLDEDPAYCFSDDGMISNFVTYGRRSVEEVLEHLRQNYEKAKASGKLSPF